MRRPGAPHRDAGSWLARSRRRRGISQVCDVEYSVPVTCATRARVHQLGDHIDLPADGFEQCHRPHPAVPQHNRWTTTHPRTARSLGATTMRPNRCRTASTARDLGVHRERLRSWVRPPRGIGRDRVVHGECGGLDASAASADTTASSRSGRSETRKLSLPNRPLREVPRQLEHHVEPGPEPARRRPATRPASRRRRRGYSAPLGGSERGGGVRKAARATEIQ